MVVISIIGLLSSIVLVALKDVREKAQATKFRAEVEQFIKALELYRVDNRFYPYESIAASSSSLYTADFKNTNQETFSPVGNVDGLLSVIMSRYMKNLPKVPTNSFPPNSIAWYYLVNPSGTSGLRYKCKGDLYTPKYVLLFNFDNPTIFNIFSYLPISVFSNNNNPWVDQILFRCFSLK